MSTLKPASEDDPREPTSSSAGAAPALEGASSSAATHYTVMARRFRPQTFGEVIGQQHVAQALKNAIASGRVAQAYLFTGARGVGKTSMARILAKALNCPNVKDGEPCNRCDICRAISEGNDVDVLEIDGASNRGIDDIRQLRANVNVKSMRTRFKMYIIDEVHMLTKEAFNALLKTLEEPPPTVKFVFCTTEPNKVPNTILSRCQRFDFSSISTSAIAAQLAQIAATEGKTVEPEAIELIARRAAGSMRDSQSLFDQLLAFGQDPIQAEDVHRLLGTADDDRLFELAEALRTGDARGLIERFDQALTQGVQLEELINQLLNYFRDLMVLAAGAQHVPLLSVAEHNRERLREQASRWGLHGLLAGQEILAAAKTRMFRSTFARALAEAALVRISLLGELRPLDDLLRLVAGSGPRTGPERRGGAMGGSGGGPPGRPTVPPSAGPTSAGPANFPPARSTSGRTEPGPGPSAGSPGTLAGGGARPAASEGRRVDLREGNEQEFWSEVLLRLDDKLESAVSAASSLAISGPNHLDLTFPRSYSFNKQVCERGLSQLEAAASAVAGQPVRVGLRLEASAPVKPEPSTRAAEPVAESPPDAFVEQVKQVFNAR